MIKLLPKIDGTVDHLDRAFLHKRRFTKEFVTNWIPYWASLTFRPLFEAVVACLPHYESDVVSRALFGTDFVGHPEAAEGRVGEDTNLVENSTFEDESEWIWGDGWYHGTRRAYWEEEMGYGNLEQDVGIIAGHTYQAVFRLLNFNDNAGVKCEIGGTQGPNHFSAGTFEEELTAVDDGNLKFIPIAGDSEEGIVMVDNVYVYDLTTLELVGTPNVMILFGGLVLQRSLFESEMQEIQILFESPHSNTPLFESELVRVSFYESSFDKRPLPLFESIPEIGVLYESEIKQYG